MPQKGNPDNSDDKSSSRSLTLSGHSHGEVMAAAMAILRLLDEGHEKQTSCSGSGTFEKPAQVRQHKRAYLRKVQVAGKEMKTLDAGVC